MAINFNEAEKATYITRRPFFTAGRHLCRVLALRSQVGKNSGADQYVAEFEVLHSSPVPLTELTPEEIAAGVAKGSMSTALPAGDQRAWLISNEGAQAKMFLPKIKQVNDAIKIGVLAMTKCMAGDAPLMTAKDCEELGPVVDGKPTGWDVSQPGATSREMTLGVTHDLAVGQCIWVLVNRTKTKKFLVIDGVDFMPLLPADFVKHDDVIGLGATAVA